MLFVGLVVGDKHTRSSCAALLSPALSVYINLPFSITFL